MEHTYSMHSIEDEMDNYLSWIPALISLFLILCTISFIFIINWYWTLSIRLTFSITREIGKNRISYYQFQSPLLLCQWTLNLKAHWPFSGNTQDIRYLWFPFGVLCRRSDTCVRMVLHSWYPLLHKLHNFSLFWDHYQFHGTESQSWLCFGLKLEVILYYFMWYRQIFSFSKNDSQQTQAGQQKGAQR